MSVVTQFSTRHETLPREAFRDDSNNDREVNWKLKETVKSFMVSLNKNESLRLFRDREIFI